MTNAQDIDEHDDEQSTTVEGSEGDDVEGNDETTDTVFTEESTEVYNDETNDQGSEGGDVEGHDETTDTVFTEETLTEVNMLDMSFEYFLM